MVTKAMEKLGESLCHESECVPGSGVGDRAWNCLYDAVKEMNEMLLSGNLSTRNRNRVLNALMCTWAATGHEEGDNEERTSQLLLAASGYLRGEHELQCESYLRNRYEFVPLFYLEEK